MSYTCSICGFEYDEKREGSTLESLPDDWHCPICNAPKGAFEPSGQ